MTTRWKGNFINFSIELYFGICFVEYTGDIPQRKGQEQRDENKIEKMTMTTMKWSLGDVFIKRT